ncbi:E3 ubiquitin-protein ligase RHF2A-like isoform X2 [Primulina huaijiensis]|uniref:E3 ubiquitin-protein ligase RHF2A-like isoform X2 n=1 Tax=Primulina huaijiensis TaxID=1492673 RepID=UPI003CC73302
MDEVKEAESRIASAAAFVEGGIQEACDDACSICLEVFCDSDPSTVTSCKHDFHLQCILEWCQRSSSCPMCWQTISLKDPVSQELLDAVEQERNIRLLPSRNTTIFRHPTLGDFELQHLPMGVNDLELEDRIIQHLAAAAAMGRTQRIDRREDYRNLSSVHARPQFRVISTHPNASSTGNVSASRAPGGSETEPAASVLTNTSVPLTVVGNEGHEYVSSSVQSNLISSSSSGHVTPTTHTGISSDQSFMSPSSLPTQDRAGPSEFQSFSESWKSRLNAISMKYKDSISKNTRGWKEKLFSKGSRIADIGSEVRREPNPGIATVTRLMEHLETRNNNRASCALLSNDPRNPSVFQRSSPDNRNAPNNGDTSAAIATSSTSI